MGDPGGKRHGCLTEIEKRGRPRTDCRAVTRRESAQHAARLRGVDIALDVVGQEQPVLGEPLAAFATRLHVPVVILVPDWLRLLGIADVDLYAPDLNFVFGEADELRGVAAFSTARLRLAAESTDRLRRRAATEAIHELGHTFGLRHCSRPSCVMWFSNTLAETDRKDVRPCAEHSHALARAIDASG